MSKIPESSIYCRIYKLESLFFQFVATDVAAFQDFLTAIAQHDPQ